MSGVDDDEAVLSEVHMETCPPHTSCWCTRFHYSMPGPAALPATPSAPAPAAAAAPSAPHCIPSHPSSTSTPASPSNCSHSKPTDANASSGANSDVNSDFEVDVDGDLVARRPARKSQFLTIHHSLATPVSRCGEQVWLGACLLADLVLSMQQQFAGQVVVELGAGVGLVSLIAGQIAARVLVTDGDLGALQLASRNIAVNSINQGSQQQQQQQQQQRQEDETQPDLQAGSASRASAAAAAAQQGAGSSNLCSVVLPRRLDWLQLFDTQLSSLSDGEVLQLLNTTSTTSSSSSGGGMGSCWGASTALAQHPAEQQQQQLQGLSQDQPQPASYSWSAADLSLLASASIWLAADVVYNETITDAFMHTAYQLMTWQQRQQQQQQQQTLLATTSGQPAVSAGSLLAGPDAVCFNSSAVGTNQQRLPVLYVAVEKRFNFTYRDLDARASAFDHFMTYVTPHTGHFKEQQLQHVPVQQPHQSHQQRKSSGSEAWDLPSGACSSSKVLFCGRRLLVDDIPQALEYDRSADLELWELVPLP